MMCCASFSAFSHLKSLYLSLLPSALFGVMTYLSDFWLPTLFNSFIGMNHVQTKPFMSLLNRAAIRTARRSSLNVALRTSNCAVLPFFLELLLQSVSVRHFNWIATELPVSLSKNSTSSPSSSAIGLNGDNRPLLAFITVLTSRFSPIAPICVEESFRVGDGIDIGSVYRLRRQIARYCTPCNLSRGWPIPAMSCAPMRSDERPLQTEIRARSTSPPEQQRLERGSPGFRPGCRSWLRRVAP